MSVDIDRLKQLSGEFAERITTIETEAFTLAGRTFNINSGPQLRQVLFDEMKLPSSQKTPGGEQSTAQDVLEELAVKHRFPALLLQHRQLSKLKSTYLDALPTLVHPDDGRIHASFNQSVAATGSIELERPQLAEHPGAHPGRPPDPPGFHRRQARLETPDGRLFPDRAPHPGALFR